MAENLSPSLSRRELLAGTAAVFLGSSSDVARHFPVVSESSETSEQTTIHDVLARFHSTVETSPREKVTTEYEHIFDGERAYSKFRVFNLGESGTARVNVRDTLLHPYGESRIADITINQGDLFLALKIDNDGVTGQNGYAIDARNTNIFTGSSSLAITMDELLHLANEIELQSTVEGYISSVGDDLLKPVLEKQNGGIGLEGRPHIQLPQQPSQTAASETPNGVNEGSEGSTIIRPVSKVNLIQGVYNGLELAQEHIGNEVIELDTFEASELLAIPMETTEHPQVDTAAE